MNIILRLHQLNYKLYLIEAWGLATFMVSACLFATMLESPFSPVKQAICNPFARLILMGLAMGLTAYGILSSPWGKASGAHINPAVSLVNYRLGKLNLTDFVNYVIFQTIGGTLAVYFMQIILGKALTDKPVQSVVTIPYCGHPVHAFWMELCIAFVLMMTIQFVSNSKLKIHSSKFAGALVCIYVIIAGPVSGFGMNPARTFASALPANNWDSFWIYAIAPVAGMLMATEIYLRIKVIQKNEERISYKKHIKEISK